MSRPQNNEKRERVLELDAAGKQPTEIAAVLGISRSLVSYYLGNRERRAQPTLPGAGSDAALPETLVTLSEDASPPVLPPHGSDVLASTLAAVLAEREGAASASDRLRAAELLLRHAGGLKAEAAWSPPREVWTAFLEEAATIHGWGPLPDTTRS